MQATTASAIAASVSAAISAASAVTAALSAWNSRRSAEASELALRETRQQRRIDNARKELEGIGTVYDQAMALIDALSIELRRDPAAVERKREVLRRSMMVAGFAGPALSRLAEATRPLELVDMAQLRAEFTCRSTLLHNILIEDADTTALGPARLAAGVAQPR